MEGMAEDIESEFEMEVELLEAMYTPEELRVQRLGKEDELRAKLFFNVGLERALVELEVELPRSFPVLEGPRSIKVSKSRGLIDSQEDDLVRDLGRQCQDTFAEQGRYSLVDMLLRAKEELERLNESGAMCAICLCSIDSNDMEVLRAECWHLFHFGCLAAWWKHQEMKEKRAGGDLSQQDRQRRQSLRDAESRFQTHSAAVETTKDSITTLRSRLAMLTDYFSWLEHSKQEANQGVEPVLPERFQPLEGTGLLEQGKRARANLQSEIRAQEQALASAIAKAKKSKEEFDSINRTVEEQRRKASQRDIHCTMCKHIISYVHLEPVLSKALNMLDQDVVVPRGWDSDIKPHESYQNLLGEEENRRLEQAKLERQAGWEHQQRKCRELDANQDQNLSCDESQTTDDARSAPASAPEPPTTADSVAHVPNDGANKSRPGHGKPNRSRRRKKKTTPS